MGRMGEVREIVEAVLYLESAMFITGETLLWTAEHTPATGNK